MLRNSGFQSFRQVIFRMIALVRKNLVSLISNHNSFVYKSPVSLLSVQFFSSSPKIYDLLLHKHHFSHELASLVASNSAQSITPAKAESVLSFLKESGCSSAQLEKIMKYYPRILSVDVEVIKFKIKLLQDLGFSSEDVAKMISSHQVILRSSAENKIIPSLSLLKNLLGSDYDVARVLRSSARVLTANLERTLMPNIEILKSCGIPMERILWLLYNQPRSLLVKPDVIRNSVDKAKEMGVCPSSNMFIYAVRCIAAKKKGTWEAKSQALRNLGFSDNDIVTMFRKAPTVFHVSIKRVEKTKELLLATGKFNISSIVDYPLCLTCSMVKRLKPRLYIFGILESKNLIEKWPSLATILGMTDVKFFEQFIRPYSDELPEVTVFGKDERDLNLQ